MSAIFNTVKLINTLAKQKWTWYKFKGYAETCKRRAMGFGQTRRENPELAALSPEEIKNRQRAAATRTHEIKRATTEEKIKAAINALIEAKEALNNSVIAKKAGLHRETVSGFSKAFDGCRFWWYQVVIGSTGDPGAYATLAELFTMQKSVVKGGVGLLDTLKRVTITIFDFFCCSLDGDNFLNRDDYKTFPS